MYVVLYSCDCCIASKITPICDRMFGLKTPAGVEYFQEYSLDPRIRRRQKVAVPREVMEVMKENPT